MLTNSTVFPIPDGGLTFDSYPMRVLTWPRMPSVVPDRFWPETAAYAVFRTPAKPPRLLGGLVRYVALRQVGWLPDRERDAHVVYAQQLRHPANVRSSKRLVRLTPMWGEGTVVEDPELGTRDTRPFFDRIHDNHDENHERIE